MTIKELFEKRAKLASQIRSMADALAAANAALVKDGKPERDFDAVERQNWERLNADYDALGAQIERAKRIESIESDLRANPDAGRTPGREDMGREGRGGRPTEEQRTLAVAGWLAEQMGQRPTAEQEEAASAVGLNLRARELVIPLMRTDGLRQLQRVHRSVFGERRASALAGVQFRDMSAGAGPSGGYLAAPEELIRRLELAMLAFGGIYEQAEVIRTAQANPLTWPSADDTGNSGEWLAEKASIGTTSVDPTIGKTTWLAHKVSSKPIKVTFELLRDSVFDLAGQLGAMLGERIARAKAAAFATGSGAGKPLGLMQSTTAATLSSGDAFTASASSITLDEVLDLIHSVDPAYRGVGAGFVMKDSTLLHFRKKKDGDGQYQWRPAVEVGAPDTLFGYPVHVCQDLAAIAASAKVMAFGQLSAYKVREVGAIRLYRLSELYRETDQDGFVAFHEVDGGLLTVGTPVKHLAMHA